MAKASKLVFVMYKLLTNAQRTSHLAARNHSFLGPHHSAKANEVSTPTPETRSYDSFPLLKPLVPVLFIERHGKMHVEGLGDNGESHRKKLLTTKRW